MVVVVVVIVVQVTARISRMLADERDHLWVPATGAAEGGEESQGLERGSRDTLRALVRPSRAAPKDQAGRPPCAAHRGAHLVLRRRPSRLTERPAIGAPVRATAAQRDLPSASGRSRPTSTHQRSGSCWGGRIRTSDWLIRSQLIALRSRDIEFLSNLANSDLKKSAGRPTDTPSQPITFAPSPLDHGCYYARYKSARSSSRREDEGVRNRTNWGSANNGTVIARRNQRSGLL